VEQTSAEENSGKDENLCRVFPGIAVVESAKKVTAPEKQAIKIKKGEEVLAGVHGIR